MASVYLYESAMNTLYIRKKRLARIGRPMTLLPHLWMEPVGYSDVDNVDRVGHQQLVHVLRGQLHKVLKTAIFRGTSSEDSAIKL